MRNVGGEVMKSIWGATPECEAVFRFHACGDWSIDFTVILRTREFTDNYLVKHELIKSISRAFAA